MMMITGRLTMMMIYTVEEESQEQAQDHPNYADNGVWLRQALQRQAVPSMIVKDKVSFSNQDSDVVWLSVLNTMFFNVIHSTSQEMSIADDRTA